VAGVERELGRGSLRRPAHDPADVLGPVAQPNAYAFMVAHGAGRAQR
jgi:hypothetical protein